MKHSDTTTTTSRLKRLAYNQGLINLPGFDVTKEECCGQIMIINSWTFLRELMAFLGDLKPQPLYLNSDN